MNSSMICHFTNVFEEVTGVKLTNGQRVRIYQLIKTNQNYKKDDEKKERTVDNEYNRDILIKKNFDKNLLNFLELSCDNNETYTTIDILREICEYSIKNKLNENNHVKLDEKLRNVLKLEKDKEYSLTYDEITKLLSILS